MNTNPRQLSAGYARAEDGIRHVFVRDLALIAMVGIYEHEKKHPQRILVNIDCAVQEAGGPLDDDIKNVVSYEKIVKNIKSIVIQDYKNFHIVVIDDASTDNTGTLIKTYLTNQKYVSADRYQVLTNSFQMKAMPNLRNTALHHCRPEEIFLIVDGDD